MNEKGNESKNAKSLLGTNLLVEQSEVDKYERKKLYKRGAILFASILTTIDIVENLSINSYKIIELTTNNNLNILITARTVEW